MGSLVEKETDLFRVDTVLRTAGLTELYGERTEDIFGAISLDKPLVEEDPSRGLPDTGGRGTSDMFKESGASSRSGAVASRASLDITAGTGISLELAGTIVG